MQAKTDAASADHRARAWAVWHGEALARVKKLPPFDRFVGGDRARQNQPLNEMKAMFGLMAGPPQEATE